MESADGDELCEEHTHIVVACPEKLLCRVEGESRDGGGSRENARRRVRDEGDLPR